MSRNSRLFAIAWIATVLCSSVFALVSAKTPVKADWNDGKYQVVEVVDGDTVKVRMGKKIESVRIIGIDTPEKYPTRTGYAECYGEEATSFAVTAFSWKTVRLVRDASQDARDTYGRILANVFLPSGSLYAEKAAVSGNAFRYVYGGKSSLYDARILRAESSAKKNGLGVWTKCDGKRKPVSKPVVPSPKPVTVPAKKPSAPVITPSAPSFSCSVYKNACADMSSCSEAMFYLNSCGLGKLDRDKDGVPCESICR